MNCQNSSICRTLGKSRPSSNLHSFHYYHLHQFWILVGYGKSVGDSVWTSLWGQAVPYVGDLTPTFMDCSVLLCSSALAHVHLCYSHLEAHWADYRSCREIRKGRSLLDSASPFICVQFTFQRFLQCQLKTAVIVWVSGAAFVLHVYVSWLFVFGIAIILDFS